MNTKLTLALDSRIIETAKRYAAAHHTSVSQLVEGYFSLLTKQTDNPANKLPPITASLSNMVNESSVGDHKQLVQEALVKKYL
jgi:hypothetical protein